MTRPYLERRNRQIMVLVERRKQLQKNIAKDFQISYVNLRVIVYRQRHARCNILGVDREKKLA